MQKEIHYVSSDVLFSAIGEMMEKNHQASFTVTGMSMWPFLCHGRDTVVVEKCGADEIRKGDILLLQTPLGNYLLHRVTHLQPGRFESTGDHLCRRDGWFPCECVRARVVRLTRKGREYTCQNYGYRFLVRIWMGLYPFRRQALWMLRKLSWIKNRIHA